MPQKKKKRDKIERIETLIEQGYYDEAEAMLRDIYHPDTPQILARINELRPKKVTTSARRRNKSKRLKQAMIFGFILGALTIVFMQNMGFAFLVFAFSCGFSFLGLRAIDSDDDIQNQSQYRQAGYTARKSLRYTPRD